MPTLTVFTPTYNRAHTLPRLFESLLRQTSKDFEWLVIDDGSTDNTKELIKSWMESSHFPIRYILQENQGMHGAHNTAYRNIETDLNTCIDSDDWMPEKAVENIINFWQKNGSDTYAGIIGLDQYENGDIIGTKFPSGLKETTLTEFNTKIGNGDKKLVFRSDIIKEYPEYPIFKDEKYVGLAYKYMLIDKDYKLLTLNKPLVIVEYQQEGSSYNMYRQYWNNPKGFSFYRKTEMVLAPSLKRKFISATHYVATSLIDKNKSFLSESPKKLLTLFAIPGGIAWYFIIKNKVRNNKKMNFK